MERNSHFGTFRSSSQRLQSIFIKYEIEQSIKRGNGLVGIQIHHLENQKKETDSPGATPKLLTDHGFKVYKYVDREKLANRIEEAAIAAGKY